VEPHAPVDTLAGCELPPLLELHEEPPGGGFGDAEIVRDIPRGHRHMPGLPDDVQRPHAAFVPRHVLHLRLPRAVRFPFPLSDQRVSDAVNPELVPARGAARLPRLVLARRFVLPPGYLRAAHPAMPRLDGVAGFEGTVAQFAAALTATRLAPRVGADAFVWVAGERVAAHGAGAGWRRVLLGSWFRARLERGDASLEVGEAGEESFGGHAPTASSNRP